MVRERDIRVRRTSGRVVSEGMGRGRTESQERRERVSQRAATMIPPVGGYGSVSAVGRVRWAGADGLLCSCRRGVSFSGWMNSLARSLMAAVLRSNWMNLRPVGFTSSLLRIVSMMMLGVRCQDSEVVRVSACRKIGVLV